MLVFLRQEKFIPEMDLLEGWNTFLVEPLNLWCLSRLIPLLMGELDREALLIMSRVFYRFAECSGP